MAGGGTRDARQPPAVRPPESEAVGVGFEVGVSSRAGPVISHHVGLRKLRIQEMPCHRLSMCFLYSWGSAWCWSST